MGIDPEYTLDLLGQLPASTVGGSGLTEPQRVMPLYLLPSAPMLPQLMVDPLTLLSL